MVFRTLRRRQFQKMIPQKNMKYRLLIFLLVWVLVIFLLFTARLTTNM